MTETTKAAPRIPTSKEAMEAARGLCPSADHKVNGDYVSAMTYEIPCICDEAAAALEAFAKERIGYVGPSNPLGYRRLCQTHRDVDYRHAWGCPDCLVDLRERNRALVEALALWLKALDSMRSFTVHDPRQHSVAEQFTEAERLARAALAAGVKEEQS